MNTGKIMGLIVGSLLASEEAAQAKFDGFYAGASVGYLNQNTSFDAKQNPANPKADMNSSTAGSGLPTAEFFGGWGKVFDGCFYGGLEGKIDLTKRSTKKVAEDTGFIFMLGRKNPSIAILSRFGYLISPHTIIYGGGGVKITRFEYGLFEKADKIPALFSKQSLHLFTEVGVEAFSNVVQTLSFRFSYSFMPKKDITQKTTTFPINHMYRENGKLKIGVTEHTIKVGIVYHF
ncbi:MAG: hypothetical protein K0R52_1551 [Alphaproteobacteria bacterium]|jgi:opacity protein-like surface antigen|nr:hypothetical protein [Alphaproteobacteria bacterium]